jgi:hypothetical protein
MTIAMMIGKGTLVVNANEAYRGFHQRIAEPSERLQKGYLIL